MIFSTASKIASNELISIWPWGYKTWVQSPTQIKHNDWLLADTCSQAANHYALYFEFENELNFETSRPVFQKNNGLLDLDISWNGFHSQGSTTLSKALEVNHCLVSLNLACNRLSEPCVAQLFNGLKHNTTLKNLRVSLKCGPNFLWMV